MRHIAGPLVLATLASCSSAPDTSDVPAALRPYADAAQFLVPGCSSLAFCREELASDGDSAPLQPARVARCGSAFEPPQGVGYGRYRGIEVWDFGPGGLHLAVQKPGLGAGRGAPTTAIAGTQVWYEPEISGSGWVPATWHVRIEDRYLVWSHERELLEQSLARSGRLAELLRPFAAVHDLPADAESVVCALPRPDDRCTNWGRPLPIEPTVSFFRPTPWRLLVLHRQPLPEQYADTASNLGASITTESGTWLMTTTVQDCEPKSAAMYRSLVAELLFGFAIFI